MNITITQIIAKIIPNRDNNHVFLELFALKMIHLLSSHSFLLHFTINQVLWGTLQQNPMVKKLEQKQVAVTSLFFEDSSKEVSHEYQFHYNTKEAKLAYDQTKTFIEINKLRIKMNKYIILVKESAFLKITLWRVLWKKQKKVVQLRF